MSIEYGLEGHLVVDSDDAFLFGVNADEKIADFYEHTIAAEIVSLAQKIHQNIHGVGGHRNLRDNS